MNSKSSQKQPWITEVTNGHETHSRGENLLISVKFDQQYGDAPATTPLQDAFFVGSQGRAMPTDRVPKSVVKASNDKGRVPSKPERDIY